MKYSEYFEYNNGLLFWKKKTSPRSRVVIGSEVGCLDANGYRVTILNGVKLYQHRIVWEMFNGEIPEGMNIDHINRDRSDNRVENLRLVVQSTNCKNLSKRRDNKTGVTGVRWHKGHKKWQSDIRVNGKLIHLGYFSDFVSACEARIIAEVTNGFSTNHGA
ncbi:hypothetical protein RCIP0045_00002 [Klebsiella phage RCIP0045]